MWFQFLREEKKKENLNKKIDCFINDIFYYTLLKQSLKKVSIKEAKVKLSLKEAKTNILTLKTKFKTAQDEGTLSPEETKDMSLEILDLVEEVANIASSVAEGVPAGDGGGINDITDDVTNDDITNDESLEGNDDTLNERINQGKDDDDEKLELKDKMAKLNAKVSSMEKEAKQKDLAVEYAKHFPITQREAKQKEFAKSTDSLPILEARLKEAKAFFKNPSVIKEAALQDSTFEINEMPGNNSHNSLDFGGKF